MGIRTGLGVLYCTVSGHQGPDRTPGRVGTMPKGQAKVYEPFDLDDLKASATVDDPNEAKKLAPPKRGYAAKELSPVMVALKAQVRDRYEKWVEVGKPKAYEVSPLQKTPVDAAKVDTLKALVTAAARHVSKDLGFSVSPEFGSKEARTADGRHVVSFRVTDPRRGPNKPKSEANGS